jgi:hypothetical protein
MPAKALITDKSAGISKKAASHGEALTAVKINEINLKGVPSK